MIIVIIIFKELLIFFQTGSFFNARNHVILNDVCLFQVEFIDYVSNGCFVSYCHRCTEVLVCP